MPDAVELIKTIKRAALDAVNAAKPVEVCFGKVVSVSPLKILVDQKMMLGEAQLVLCRNVTDFKTTISVVWNTQSALNEHTHGLSGVDSEGDVLDLTTEGTNLSHTHEIVGRKTITVHNGLVVGDEVLLLRQQGGQKYIVKDRIP